MIFIDNKYTAWYNRIVNNAKSRLVLDGYTETHHIIPRSLGGDDKKENLVKLSAKEHFVCHRLLPKMTSGTDKRKMVFAQNMMLVKTNKQRRIIVNSNTYRIIKEEFAIVNPFNNKDFQNSVVKNHLGKKRSVETREKLKKAWTPERKAEHIKRRTGMKNSTPSPFKGKKRPELAGENNGFFGKKHTKELIERRRNEMLGTKPVWADRKLTCPHCNRELDLGNYKRYHGDKCKLKL